MSAVVTTFEHAILTEQHLTHAQDFAWLVEQNLDGFGLQRRNGQWQLKVGHYLGVIGLPSGQQLEILPKITQQDSDDIEATRAWVRTMLLCIWQGVSPKGLTVLAEQAITEATMPLGAWIATYFWRYFCQYQPNRQYQALRQNQSALQGKLLLSEQLRHNLHQPHKFFSERDQFVPDTASNRLVKAAFGQLAALRWLPTAALPPTWQPVGRVVPRLLENTFYQSQQELASLNAVTRVNAMPLLQLCYFILTAQQALPTLAHSTHQTWLINMQSAFEQWVTQVITQHVLAQGGRVQAQPSQALVTDGNTTLLSIKPDLLLECTGTTIVADIKWKAITHIRDIRLADMYQLLTYADETQAAQAWLIYPTLQATATALPIKLVKPRQTACWLVPFLVKQGQLRWPEVKA